MSTLKPHQQLDSRSLDKNCNLHTLLLKEEGLPKSIITNGEVKDHQEAGKVESAFLAFNKKKKKKGIFHRFGQLSLGLDEALTVIHTPAVLFGVWSLYERRDSELKVECVALIGRCASG